MGVVGGDENDDDDDDDMYYLLSFTVPALFKYFEATASSETTKQSREYEQFTCPQNIHAFI